MYRTLIPAFAAGFFAAAPLAAHEFTAGDLVVDHPFAFETTATALSAGGYLVVTNTGSTPDRLIGVEADFPRVMIHTTEEKNGVARMMHVDAIEIPAGGSVELAPGGYHVMFMGLEGDAFEVGEEIPATLIFENAGRVDVLFVVESRDGAADGGVDHSGHTQ